MTRRPLRTLPPRGTRLAREDARKLRLEAVAAEFALGAQRRARLMRQLDLLDRQRQGATQGLAQLDARLAVLSRRMAALQPDAAAPEPDPAPEPPRPAPPARRGRMTLEY